MMKTAKLLLHCPDKPGILAEVTDFITVNKGNIIYLTNMSIMWRISFSCVSSGN